MNSTVHRPHQVKPSDAPIFSIFTLTPRVSIFVELIPGAAHNRFPPRTHFVPPDAVIQIIYERNEQHHGGYDHQAYHVLAHRAHLRDAAELQQVDVESEELEQVEERDHRLDPLDSEAREHGQGLKTCEQAPHREDGNQDRVTFLHHRTVPLHVQRRCESEQERRNEPESGDISATAARALAPVEAEPLLAGSAHHARVPCAAAGRPPGAFLAPHARILQTDHWPAPTELRFF